jgi:SAM-dependent methyltransferase
MNMTAALAASAKSNPILQHLSYGTVRDFCDSADRFPDLSSRNRDLKDGQRPWAVKTLADRLPRGARLLEIGGGEPLAAETLVQLGYNVTLCDPFEGQGNGPTQFEAFRKIYPKVIMVRSLFTSEWARRCRNSYDAVFSISVLEHIHSPALEDVFEGIRIALRPGGLSLHAVDHILEGEGREGHEAQMARVLEGQASVAGVSAEEGWAETTVNRLMTAARGDLETLLLSAHGFNGWRGQTPYAKYPFRKVCSMQTLVWKPFGGQG